MDLGISGLASNFDWKTFVSQMIQTERAPEDRLRTQQSSIQQRNQAYGNILTQLNTLNDKITALNDPSLFNSRSTSLSDTSVASATATSAATLGSYTFNITQMANAASWRGNLDPGKALNSSNDVSGLVLGTAGFVNGITAGTFTVNGKTINVATTDTLKSVFDQINSATGGVVSGSYDSSTDTISLATNDNSQVVLGSATDTSNFLQSAKLFNNGTGTVTSSSALGGINLGSSLTSANLNTAITDGGAGAGAFKINGVEIDYNAANDSVNDVLARINNSAAGVTASYDPVNDRFQLTNKTTGDVGISVQDVTGNFLAATGLGAGTLQRGTNLLYNINGGGTLTSQSNSITSNSSGLAGLTVNAFTTGSTVVTVGSDTGTIKSAITDFVSQYNAVQSLIDNYTASSTDAKGTVTAGTLAGEMDANDIETTLRHMASVTLSGLSSSGNSLDALGIVSNGQDNTLSIADESKLDAALTNNLNDVKNLFTDATSGIGTKMAAYLKATAGDTGTISTKQTSLTKQSTDIDTTIANMERVILADQQRLTDSFVAMETSIQSINQQGAYLTKTFGA